MCCGNGPSESEVAALLAGPPVMEEPLMVKVFTVVKGSELRIGAFGVATNEAAANVPDDVAATLDPALFRVEGAATAKRERDFPKEKE